MILTISTFAKKEVIVGGYEFPPFVILKNNAPSGMTIDLINALNQFQEKYQFTFKPTSAKRRYLDFNKKKYDLIFFENIIWGWQEEPIEPTKVILNGGEVFIAKAQPDRDETFFSTFKGKTILGIVGYHYQFANLVTDKDYLSKYFNMRLGNNHEDNIKNVVTRKEPTIAIVTKSYLNLFLNQNPKFRDKILVSKKFDQVYRHTILVRKDNHPTTSEMNSLIDNLRKNGKLDEVWKKYGKEKKTSALRR